MSNEAKGTPAGASAPKPEIDCEVCGWAGLRAQVVCEPACPTCGCVWEPQSNGHAALIEDLKATLQEQAERHRKGGKTGWGDYTNGMIDDVRLSQANRERDEARALLRDLREWAFQTCDCPGEHPHRCWACKIDDVLPESTGD